MLCMRICPGSISTIKSFGGLVTSKFPKIQLPPYLYSVLSSVLKCACLSFNTFSVERLQNKCISQHRLISKELLGGKGCVAESQAERCSFHHDGSTGSSIRIKSSLLHIPNISCIGGGRQIEPSHCRDQHTMTTVERITHWPHAGAMNHSPGPATSLPLPSYHVATSFGEHTGPTWAV